MMSKDDDPSDDLIDRFLQGTSRTFALAIPLLAAQRRRQIGLSYLLFRIVDSIEDAADTDVVVKCELLLALRRRFSQTNVGLVHSSDAATNHGSLAAVPIQFRGLWPDDSPTGQLLLAFPRLLAILESLPASVQEVICKSLNSTISGMHKFIEASKGLPRQIQLQSLDDLRAYCYVVAGIVGEMLTDIFVYHHSCGQAVYPDLRRHSIGFGAFLQLVNILKDSKVDAAGGRLFIPGEASRESVYQLAMVGMEDARTYISLLARNGFPKDIVLFCRFIFMLAEGSLQRLRDRGAGSKLTRTEVSQILTAVQSDSAYLSEYGLA
ncbi:MAG TPA: hypothetical protein DCF63_06455 [Planctomycetaceae bacterium]|nr:hypothetical protein [Planctomycetaceae bacterium]